MDLVICLFKMALQARISAIPPEKIVLKWATSVVKAPDISLFPAG